MKVLSESMIIVRCPKSIYLLSIILSLIFIIRRQFAEDKNIHLNMFLFVTTFISNNFNIILCLCILTDDICKNVRLSRV